MFEYDCRNKCVFNFRQNTVNDEADVMEYSNSITANKCGTLTTFVIVSRY